MKSVVVMKRQIVSQATNVERSMNQTLAWVEVLMSRASTSLRFDVTALRLRQ